MSNQRTIYGTNETEVTTTSVNIGTAPSDYTLPQSRGINSRSNYKKTDGAGNCAWTDPESSNPFDQDLNSTNDVTFQNATLTGSINASNNLELKQNNVIKFGADALETSVVGAGIGNLYGIANGVHSFRVGAIETLKVKSTGCVVDSELEIKRNGNIELKIVSDANGAMSILDGNGNYLISLSGDLIAHVNYANSGTGRRISTTRARGTQSSPAPVIQFDRFTEITDYGIDSVVNTGGFACIVSTKATENWSPGNHGTSYEIGTVNNGTTSVDRKLLLDSNGVTLHNASNSYTMPSIRGAVNSILSDIAGNGNLAWNNINDLIPTKAYGEMYFKHNGTQTAVGVQGTYYRVSGTYSAGLLSNFTLNTNLLTYTGVSQTFKVSVNVSWANVGVTPHAFSLAIWKNGALVASSSIRAMLDDSATVYPRNCSTVW